MKLSQLKQIIKEEIQNALKEGKRTFKLKIINKNGTSTIQSVSVDPSTTELFTIIANLKQSKNVKDVKILEDEIQDSLKETNSKEQTAVEWLVSTLNKPGFAPVLTEEEIKQALRMEKEQIMDAYDMGYLDYNNLTYDSAEQFYNGTYK